MRKLVIETEAVRHNLSIVKDRAQNAVIYAVLTGNGAGVGTVELAKLLRDDGIRRFAVSEVSEAVQLRNAGFLEEEILMLRSTTDRNELEDLIDHNCICTISSVDTGMALNAVAERRSTVAEAHIQIDTGMGFGGFLVSEPEKILLAYRSLPNVALAGIYTQLHAVSTGDSETKQQLEVFQNVLETIHAAGFETGTIHAAGSFALLHHESARFDGVRAGSVLLGRCRRTRDDRLRQVGYGEVSLAEVRWLPKGHTIGADKPVILKRPTRIAVLPVGYENGFGVSFCREQSLWSAIRRWYATKKRTVRIGGQKVKILGAIGATETILNVTNVKCTAGDIAILELDPLYARGFEREFR